MSRVDLAPTIAYYRGKLAEHGPGAEGMDWKDFDTQRLRFEVIARYIDWSAKPSILDVGCGSGEFLAFCKAHQRDVEYLGLDVCPEMVAASVDRFGADSALVGTVEGLDSDQRSFDYVIASGTFNAKLDEDETTWRQYFHNNVVAMYGLCRRATIVNTMTCFVDYRYDRLYYASPDEMSALAVSRMSRDFVIDHSYPLYEMTLAVFRTAAHAVDG